jgi:hypothetical protein
LMDCNMPIMDGWQVVILRETETRRDWDLNVYIIVNYVFLCKYARIHYKCFMPASKIACMCTQICAYWSQHLSK